MFKVTEDYEGTPEGIKSRVRRASRKWTCTEELLRKNKVCGGAPQGN